MVKTVDDRSPTAKAMSQASEVIAACMLMIVPALIGYLVDQKVGTGFLFTVLGLIFGMVGAVLQLMRLVAATDKPSDESSENDDSTKQT